MTRTRTDPHAPRHLAIWQLLALGALVTFALSAAPDTAGAEEKKASGTIMVTALDFKNDKGQAVVAMYQNGKHWLDLKNAYRKVIVPIENGRIMVSFKNVPHGEYGVTVLHDENKNGKMDMQWVPYPSPEEGGGVSNNYIRAGKPEYSKAKFDFERSLMSVRIKIFY